MLYPEGEFVKATFTSSDASTAAALSFTNDNGVARTIGASERLVITSYHLVSGSAVTVELFDDANANGTVDAGERIGGGDFAANGGLTESSIEHPCQLGKTPKIKASASGTVKAVVRGHLIK